MKNLNIHIIKGTIGRDARINKVGERAVANFSVATEYDFKKSDGSWGKETTWHNVSAWQGFGICDLELLVKGTPVLVVGRERTREWTDQQGQKHTEYELLAESLDILATEKPVNKASSGAGNGKGHFDEDIF